MAFEAQTTPYIHLIIFTFISTEGMNFWTRIEHTQHLSETFQSGHNCKNMYDF